MPTFTEVCDEHGVEYREGGSHSSVSVGWVGINCPFCGEEDGFHMGWRDGFVCWKCGPQRSGEVLSLILNVPMRTAIDIAKSIEPETESAADALEREGRTRRLKMPEGMGPLLKMHTRYLRERNLDPRQMVNLWELQGIGNGFGFMSRRVIIPIRYRGHTVSWTSRAIDAEVERRYRAAGKEDEKIPHKSLLFGEDLVRSAIIVHEGPFDVFATGPGAVAVCGTGVSAAQIRRIAKYQLRVICFDTSVKAQERARALQDAVCIHPGRTLRVELDAEDAGSASERELRKLRKLIDI